MKRRGRDMCVTPPSGVGHSVIVYSTLMTSSISWSILEGHSDVLCRNIARQISDNGLNRFILLCVKCKEVQFFSKRYFYVTL
jgi:hypothetical protein